MFVLSLVILAVLFLGSLGGVLFLKGLLREARNHLDWGWSTIGGFDNPIGNFFAGGKISRGRRILRWGESLFRLGIISYRVLIFLLVCAPLGMGILILHHLFL